MQYGSLRSTGNERIVKKFRQLECECVCGSVKWYWANNLRRGASASCGCLAKVYQPGTVFGELTVLSRAGRKAVVRCSCGAEREIYAHALKTQRSCGCAVLDRSEEGNRYGSLTISEVFRDGEYTKARCVCDCGTEVVAHKHNVLAGRTSSCGHWRKYDMHEMAQQVGVSYNEAVRLRSTWSSMHSRCYSPDNPRYPRYGGRGIVVSPEWHDLLEFVKWAAEEGSRRGVTVDRIDNDGDYSPDNCRLATDLEQSRNRSDNHHVTAWGERKIIADWVRDVRCAVPDSTLSQRLSNGWSPEEAISTPPRGRRRSDYRKR